MNLDFNVVNWNWNQAEAAGKHLASATAGAIALAVGYHFLAPSQVLTDVPDNINHIVSGLEETAKGIAGLVSAITLVYTAIKSATKASPVSQAISLEKIPGTVVITTPEIAKATPDSPNVISNTEVKVVPK